METRGTYLYAVMPGPTPTASFRASPVGGGDGAQVRLVEEGDLAAVVSDAPVRPYDPTRDNLAAHERVVEEIMQHREVLPVRFGTVAGGDPEIKRFLRDKHDDLARSLERMKGRVELGLKVLWDRDVVLAEVLTENADVRALRDELAQLPDAQTYEQRIELGRLTTDALEQKRRDEADRIVERLRPLVVDVAVNRLLGETMVLNAAFLVERASMQAFDDAVNALGTEQKGRLTFRYVGPVPPYDFVNITVGKA